MQTHPESISEKKRNTRAWKIAAVVLAAALLLFLLPQLFLRNFYRFLTFDPTFCEIFRQISLPQSKISPSFFVPVILLLLFACGIVALWRRGGFWRVPAVILGLLAGFTVLLTAILLTSVNGVMFLDVVRTLIPLLMKGAL